MFDFLERLMQKYSIASIALLFTMLLIPIATCIDGMTHTVLNIPSSDAWYIIDAALTFIVGYPASIFLLGVAKRLQDKEIMLTHALTTIQQLESILPMCSSCKKIRSKDNQWLSPDVYIRNHTASEISHSLCQPCQDQLYPSLKHRCPKG